MSFLGVMCDTSSQLLKNVRAKSYCAPVSMLSEKVAVRANPTKVFSFLLLFMLLFHSGTHFHMRDSIFPPYCAVLN